jgi:predicted ester cyclase
MSVEENKALVRRFVEEFWSAGNLAAADELIANDAMITLPGIGQVDHATLKAFARTLRGAFPDWHSTLEAMVGEGETIAERWTGTGTHQGEFQGIAPTCMHVQVPGTVFYRIASGKIVEFRGLFDGLAMMRQLGNVPAHALPGA